MLSWIVAQSTPVVALTILVWSYTLAATAYAVVALAHRFGHGATLRAISPVTLTPLVMLFGLFAALIQLTIAMLHVDIRAAKLITMFLFATAVAASMLLIMAYDQPFSTGGVRVLPTALQDVMPD